MLKIDTGNRAVIFEKIVAQVWAFGKRGMGYDYRRRIMMFNNFLICGWIKQEMLESLHEKYLR